MATYGRDSKGEYKIRDDGTKVYRDESNSKYFPNDYGGTAGWYYDSSSGSSSKSSSSSSSSSSSKSTSSSSDRYANATAPGKGEWNFNDQKWDDVNWVNNYINHMIDQGNAARASGDPNYMRFYDEAQRVKNAALERGLYDNIYIPARSSSGGGSVGGRASLQGSNYNDYILNTIDQMSQYLTQQPRVPEYVPPKIPRMTAAEARERAREYIDPIYDEIKRETIEAARREGIQRGLNDAALQGFIQQAALEVDKARAQALSAYTEELLRQDEIRAMQLEQEYFNRWLAQQGLQSQAVQQYNQNLNTLLSSLFNYGSLLNQQTQIGIQQGYLDEARRTGEWQRNVQFPMQMALQRLGMEMENEQFLKDLELRWYNAETGRLNALKPFGSSTTAKVPENPWGFETNADVLASLTADVEGYLEDIAVGRATYGTIKEYLTYLESQGMLPEGYADLVLEGLRRRAPAAYQAYQQEQQKQQMQDTLSGNRLVLPALNIVGSALSRNNNNSTSNNSQQKQSSFWDRFLNFVPGS